MNTTLEAVIKVIDDRIDELNAWLNDPNREPFWRHPNEAICQREECLKLIALLKEKIV